MLKIQNNINYFFKDLDILKKALTHSSINYKSNYENLEFLGDSIINFFITEWIYKKYPHLTENEMTVMKNQYINKDYLSKISNILKISEFASIDKNIEISTKISCELFESIVAAIYLDSNIKNTKKFLNKNLIKNFEESDKVIDYKGELIIFYQKKIIGNLIIQTEQLNESKIFISKISFNKYHFYGFGFNKIKAEQNGALFACKHIKDTILQKRVC
ncbi:MAG: hypothetical protein CMG64_04095 [Candidatus Marinimicrobia bacterium]|nr:hypothetical protein [Candidatus Neomarinimicrobiota bacterium]|tara:strand:+ start:16575 stop:17225 length:651 start_codon:yes stop_codon:yes gene_type:complete